MNKRSTGEGALHWLQTAGKPGIKLDDELPIPHHSGYVDGEEKEPVFDHQKITG